MREEGFYRIKLHSGNWTVAEWVENGASSGWYIPCSEEPIDEEKFEAIGEKIVFLCGWERLDPVPIHTDCGRTYNNFSQKLFMDFCPYCGGKIVWR